MQFKAQVKAFKLLKEGKELSSQQVRLAQVVTQEDLMLIQASAPLRPAPPQTQGSTPTKKRKLGESSNHVELADLQKAIRQAFVEEEAAQIALHREPSHKILQNQMLDREFYRRAGIPFSLKYRIDSRSQTKLEQAYRSSSGLIRQIQMRELLPSLLNFQHDFMEFHNKKEQYLKKQVYTAKNHLEWLDRKRQSVKDKMEKERMKALKENDFDTYLQLISSAKNNRLLDILKQTDSFLRQLGAKVRVQKGEATSDFVDLPEQELTTEQIAESLQTSTRMYYSVTHSISEEIKEQPRGIEGGQLKQYQLFGLQWLISLYNNNLHGILADEMGLGKTIQTISLFQYLIEVKNVTGPFLVVVPLSTMSNWVMEMNKWAPNMKKIVYKGPPQARRQCLQTITSRKFNTLLTTYDYIMKDKSVLSKVHWCYIVVDEGHRMKNAKSKFAQILGLQYQSDHRLLLTGTPLQNNLAELWALLNFLLPHIFHSMDDFEKWFNQPMSRTTDERQFELNEEETLLITNRLHQVLRPFLLRRVKKEVESELPDKVESVLKVELSSWQKLLYKSIQDHGFAGSDPITGRARNLHNSVMQLRKVCNHPYLFNSYPPLETSDEIWRCSGKFELLDRMLPKLITSGHKLLLFCQMTQLMDILQRYFEYRGYRHLRLDGATKSEERDLCVELFNQPGSQYPVFILSTRAGGLGLNLQVADTVIIFDSDWNPHVDLQAQDRAHRIGQKREVRVYRLVTNTKIEEAILSRAAYKKRLDGRVIQAGLFNNKSTDKERQEKLKIMLRSTEDEDNDEQPVFTDYQINQVIARTDEEFDLFERMDAERFATEPYEEATNPRLIVSKNYPFWLCSEEAPAPPSESDMFSRGARMRKLASYAEDDFEDEPRAPVEGLKITISTKDLRSESEEIEDSLGLEYSGEDGEVGEVGEDSQVE